MFFDKVDEIEKIARRNGTSIFVLPGDVEFELAGAIVLKPKEKTVITIAQVHEVLELINVKQKTDRFIVIRPADKMGTEAANAFLKNLEEPSKKIHFVLITDSPSKLLPTILSRSSLYFLREDASRRNEIIAEPEIKSLAKRLITAKSTDLPAVAEEISKRKDGIRDYTLNILGVAIEMLYKSYYLTGKVAFLTKLPKFLKTYENIEKNGHVKLHLVADLC